MRRTVFALAPLLLLACMEAAAPDPGPILTSIEVTPGSLYLTATGQEASLTAVPKDQFGDAMSGIVLTWTSDNTPVATVDKNGVVRAGAESCLALVRAMASDMRGATVVSNVVSVEVALSSASVQAGPPMSAGCAR